jgi:beta-1,4-mannosyl-glycoprotein beta-1,4-N-acetylglucosaminyltransferase
LRLKELYDVVDFFVIVEGTHTFIGTPKESNFEKHRDRYEPYMKKIRYFYLPNLVNPTNAWTQEYKQRENIYHALKILGAQSTDTVTICDCDEIPRPQVLEYLRGTNCVSHLMMMEFWYNIETLNDMPCGSTCVCSFELMEQSYNETYRIDDWHFAKKRWCGGIANNIRDAGWHFTYFGDFNKISEKIANFSHQECNTLDTNNIDNIIECVSQKILYFNKDIKFIYKPLCEMRQYLPKNIDLII